MRKTVLCILLICVTATLNAQPPGPSRDSLKKALAEATDDYVRFWLAHQLGQSYVYRYPDSAVTYAQQIILLAGRLKSDSLLFHALGQYKVLLQVIGNYPQALQYGFEALKAAERTKNFMLIGLANNTLGDLFRDQGDYTRALFYAKKAKSIFDAHFTYSLTAIKNKNDTVVPYAGILYTLAVAFEKNNQLDSALKYIQMTEQLTKKLQQGQMLWPAVPFCYGNIYSKLSDYPKAIRYYHWGINIAIQRDIKKDIMDNGYGLANVYKKMNQPDSGIYYANKVLQASKFARHPLMQLNALALLADVYKGKQDIDSTAKYFELALAMKDSLFNQDKVMQMQNQTFNEQVRQQKFQEEQQKRLYRNRIYATLAFAIAIVVIALLLWRNIRHKQKAFDLLQNQKEETDRQKAKAEQTLEELKTTQSQLIQSEKMASLGELTAGIAHEIQNPLNFVNNFSDVNTELIEDMEQEIDKGNFQEVKAIANDLKENQQKITHHGKRADTIVKGMLQHSRSSTSEKEPTDINKLADEYLRLCYHGLRAKDPFFNATMQTDFDQSLEKINIIPQDIGRVLLNLFTNAFYSVSERKKAPIP